MHRIEILKFVYTITLFFLVVLPGYAQSESDLAKKTQNPVSDLISVPLQNNINFGIGPEDRTQNVLNIQPVIPVSYGNWNFISRLIVPLIYQPDIAESSGGEFGLGDINYTIFVSPKDSKKLIWGIGPALQFPTATDEVLGSEKFSIGPSLVALTMRGRWVAGFLINNLWSVAGDDDRDDVNQMLFQYFINYNFQKGWYLTTSPILTANWKQDGDDTWTVPVGGGFGKIFRVGTQNMNAQVQAFYNPVHPDDLPYPDWSLRLQMQFLFPK